jgi:aspartate aminotransferase-like enzyme
MNPINFLPGPVPIHPSVHEAFAAPPVSHRSSAFTEDLRELSRRLASWVKADKAALLLGSGTLANDAVAAQLSLRDDRGLIPVNGEFGERLVDHARRMGLEFSCLEAPWGETFEPDAVAAVLDRNPKIGWLWLVHCETSTGVLHDVEALGRICRDREIDLVLDCISSLGTVPVDLEGVRLATGSSGKGIASFPGLGLVFHHHEIEPSPSLPRYLDLGYLASKGGLPFTTSTNLIYALRAALDRHEELRSLAAGDGAGQAEKLMGFLRGELETAGWRILAPPVVSSPAVVTLAPAPLSALDLGEWLETRGFWLSYRSEYLVRRNLIQVCLMGEHHRGEVEALLARLEEYRDKA